MEILGKEIFTKEHMYILRGLCLWSMIYIAAVVFYRLILSPLAKFPGPRLAAATGLYETYYQIVKGGRYTWVIDSLHDKYGPVVRVTPREIHIKDPDYYSTVYAGPGRHRNKDPWFSFIGFPLSIFSTDGYELHRERRKVMGQFFKKNAIVEFEPVIQANVQSLCRHFSTAAKTHKPLELHAAFQTFTSDTVSQHAFGRSNGFHRLEEPEITATWLTQVNWVFEFIRITRHFPILCHFAHFLPTLCAWFVPPFGHVHQLEEDVRHQVRKAIHEHENSDKEKQSMALPVGKGSLTAIYPTILAAPEVTDSEKTFKRLQDDAIFLLIAGTDAPSQALAITMFHLLNNPVPLQKLRAELFAAIPDANTMPSLQLLETLPYLSATVREGLRISSIVTTRLPRSAPDEDLQYQQWHIPAGTLVSMSTYFILRDPEIFLDPATFLPERWLLPQEELNNLQKYLLPASKGTLGCLGPNMAWAWMHLLIGTLIRRFDLALHETTERNVEMTRDNFIGQTDRGYNRVQVKVAEEYQS
ncbi:cytochrome P450 [Aspergillus alliaceus]|uniref:Cytochrome P450 n=1 Tax=Petromyces alliaceus TaxID=209559 RepID=A0A5N7CAF6_PETAA|nr:cytochrome P450 [Aspergillus alliaceus]